MSEQMAPPRPAHRIDPHILQSDPHEVFAALRARHAVVELGERHYLALRANAIQSLLTHPLVRQVEGEEYVAVNRIPDGVAARIVRHFFLFANGDAHRAKRGPFARAFSFAAVRAARPAIRNTARRIVAEAPRGEVFDFVDQVAARVPAEMIAALLGLPAGDVAYFTPRVYALAQAIAPFYPHERHDEIETAASELWIYVADALTRRMAAPREDLLSELVEAWRSGSTLTFEELVVQVIGIIIGGSDTTRAAFAMLVTLLLQHPRQWGALRRDSSLVPGAVLEGLRFEPSVGSVVRFTLADIDVEGIAIPQGTMVRLSTMSAMRDGDLYDGAGRFDITRDDHPRLHMAFGHGPHRCLGEMLARVEMEEALAAVIEDAADLELLTIPTLTGYGGIRQIRQMMTLLPAARVAFSAQRAVTGDSPLRAG